MDDRPPRPRTAPSTGPRPDLAAFDEALAGLSARRPLVDVLADVARAVAKATGTPNAFLTLGDEADPGSSAGVGIWSAAVPADVERQVRHRRDVLHLPDYGAWPQRAMSRSPLGELEAVPILAGAEVVGVLGIGNERGRALDPDARALLDRFARLVALGRENAGLLASEHAARRRERALRAATEVLSAPLRLQDVMAAILDELQNVVPHDTASVQELRDGRMVIVGGRGIDLGYFLGFAFDASGSGYPNGDVLRRKTPVIVPDILGDHPYPEFPNSAHALSGVRCWMGVPLLLRGECTGMLTLDKLEPDFYTEDHAQTALAFAAQAAIALENARLYERSQREVDERRRAEEELREANQRLHDQIAEIEELQSRLREQAIRDPLTGLYNRRFFTETLQRELARAAREGRPLSLALLDIDHFKEINDASGHDAGDRVLEALGGFFRERSRESDVACRYGGEEFVILLLAASGADASARAETWRAALEEFTLPGPALGRRLTVSIGVAEFPTHARNADDLIRMADVALYQAKREGRNRVVLAR